MNKFYINCIKINKIKYEKTINNNRGFSLAEIIVVVGITGLIMIAISSFQVGVINNNKYSQDSLSSAQDARNIVRVMTKELRSASRSNNGSYAIIQAATNTIAFYSDVDGNGTIEQIRYFIATSTLKKGIIVPTGSPLVYNSSNEVMSTLAENVKNATSSSLFEYYDGNYAGTSTPLTQPVSVTQVRLVKINLIIDANPNKSPISRTYTSQVSLRNLKDNL